MGHAAIAVLMLVGLAAPALAAIAAGPHVMALRPWHNTTASDVPLVLAWMDATEPPQVRARKLVAAMNASEMISLFHGSCGGYTGNVCANTRLGIPPLKMNDGPQGFRGAGSTSTAFPAAVTIAASFDPEMARRWGEAMGDEFFRKGANVQLGPGLCLARVPRNGRNFEYVSGEDPLLGMHLGGAVVQGIQSMGVVANAKHWVNNNQETDRHFISENVDERVQFELYYPPFEGAIARYGSAAGSHTSHPMM
jgi:beta-glucosidase